MSIAFGNRIPSTLIQELFETDRLSCGTPKLPSEKRDVAIHWLRRVLVDFEALDQHIALLQKLYGASFQYPRPRRDQWDVEQPLDPPASSEFTHVDRISDDRLATILDQGIDNLDDEELGALLLNPYALFDLFDVIDDVQPEYWLDAIHDLVVAQPRPRRTWPPFVETKTRPEHTATSDRSTIGLGDASKELRRNVDSTLSKDQHPDFFVREPTFRYGAWMYALAVAATIAIIILGWGVIRMDNSLMRLPEAIATLTNTVESDAASQRRTGMRLTAGPAGAESLREYFAEGKLNPAYYENDPEQAKETLAQILSHADPVLRALISSRKELHDSDAAVLKYLRSLFVNPESKGGR